jgi:hypothetical protein
MNPLDRDTLNDRVNEQAQSLALDCHDDRVNDRLTPPVAGEHALTALRAASLALGLHGMLLPGIAPRRGTARRRTDAGKVDTRRAERDEQVSEWLRHAEGLRADFAEVLPAALEFVAGRAGKGLKGMDQEDAVATAVARLLAIGLLCVEAAAWLIYLKGTPRNRP